MLHALHRLRHLHGWALHVVHVDHGIRAAAAHEATAVLEQCAAWGVPGQVVRVDVPGLWARARLNLQAAARYARYYVFGQTAQALNAAGVLVAHTADDVAETLLLHLLRGSGLDGLARAAAAAVAARRRAGSCAGPGSVVAGRLGHAAAAAGVPRRHRGLLRGLRHPTRHGAPRAYRRDRIRSDLLPRLEEYNPRARPAIARAATALAEERAAVEAAAAEASARLLQREGTAVMWPLADWLALPIALQKRVLAHAILALGGSAEGLSARPIDAALALARRQTGRGVNLPGGLRLEREPEQLGLFAPQLSRADATTWTLLLPGAVAIPEVGSLRAERHGAAPSQLPAATALECWLDATTLGAALGVPLHRPGDRFQPLGLSRPKRLQDYLVNARVPRGRATACRWSCGPTRSSGWWASGLGIGRDPGATPRPWCAWCSAAARGGVDGCGILTGPRGARGPLESRLVQADQFWRQPGGIAVVQTRCHRRWVYQRAARAANRKKGAIRLGKPLVGHKSFAIIRPMTYRRPQPRCKARASVWRTLDWRPLGNGTAVCRRVGGQWMDTKWLRNSLVYLIILVAVIALFITVSSGASEKEGTAVR